MFDSANVRQVYSHHRLSIFNNIVLYYIYCFFYLCLFFCFCYLVELCSK